MHNETMYIKFACIMRQLLCVASLFYVFLPALLISVDAPPVSLLLPLGTNYPPLSGSPTHWTHLNVG